MKIAIVGCGAIGGYMGAKLALAGEEVTFIVRGAGVRLITSEGAEHVVTNVTATQHYTAASARTW